MIENQEDVLALRAAWIEHLRSLLDELEFSPSSLVDHLTSSVALYCQQNCRNGVQRADLDLLLARAFCAVNDRESAARVLSSFPLHARHVERWLEVLSELHHFPALLPFFSLGIIRPADWAGARMDRMWILDLRRLALSDSERHEILLYRSLRSIFENMFVFWDATAGEGVLGLKGLACFNLGPGRPRGLTEAGDLMAYANDLFARQKAARNWRTVPRVLNLDL